MRLSVKKRIVMQRDQDGVACAVKQVRVLGVCVTTACNCRSCSALLTT